MSKLREQGLDVSHARWDVNQLDVEAVAREARFLGIRRGNGGSRIE